MDHKKWTVRKVDGSEKWTDQELQIERYDWMHKNWVVSSNESERSSITFTHDLPFSYLWTVYFEPDWSNSVPFDVAAEDKAANNPLAMIFFFILTISFLLMNFQTKLNLIMNHNLWLINYELYYMIYEGTFSVKKYCV